MDQSKFTILFTDHVPHPQGENLNCLRREKNVDDVDGCVQNGCVHELYKDLRHVQRRTKCNEKTILDFITTFEKHLGCTLGGNLRACDKKMQVHEQAMSAIVFVFIKNT